jgi:hypothetical protein
MPVSMHLTIIVYGRKGFQIKHFGKPENVSYPIQIIVGWQGEKELSKIFLN